ncbi:MFS transporter [Streptomyces sp. SID14478]|uniref:MFS transporter n=1 Tax=Streptomyces sp. SID14478 TaxID=2706073 RepID=UPI0013E03E97|nr:MFS transporter [Streptomyces sp. SID14478]NEB80860.1 MFS transporter [Streptomyces sp. SID14478]
MPENTAAPQTAPPTGAVVAVPRRWWRLTVLAPTVLTDNSETSVLSTLFASIRQTLGLSLGALGILQATSRIVGVICGPLWISLAQRWGRRRVLVASGTWMATATALCAAAQNYAQLLTLFALASIGAAAGQPVIHDIIADLFDENSRGRAVGWLYGGVTIVGSLLTPVIAQVAGAPGGWRTGFLILAALMLLSALLVLFLYEEPTAGAGDGLLAQAAPAHPRLDRAVVAALFRSRTFTLMVVQRLISGHLLAGTFAVVFLVDTYGFTTQTAALIAVPSGLGYFLGTVAGGILTDRVHRAHPWHGRVTLLQLAQLLYAAAAFLGTQIDWGSIMVFAALFGVMAFFQGLNPGINRPLVMAVTLPELRGPAFAVLISIAEALAYAIFALGAGALGEAIGLQTVFLWVLVVLMAANAAFCGLLHLTYPADVRAVRSEIDRRNSAAVH